MSGLDIFALIVLLVVILTLVGGWVALGLLPGRIAAKRKHPQTEAINICGIMGIVTMGLLLPFAYIWAYTKSSGDEALK